MPLGQGWPNRAESPQQGQSVGTQERGEGRLFGRGQGGGLGWGGAGEQSFAGWVLSAVVYTEQCSPDYGVCSSGACLDSSQAASGQFHPWTTVPLLGFLGKGMDKGH